MNDRVELQTEVGATREAVFGLVATADGLRRGSMRQRWTHASAVSCA